MDDSSVSVDSITVISKDNSKNLNVKQMRKRRRKLRRKLFFKHHRGHWEELIRGTIPIFVAASINKVVSLLLEIMVGSGGLRIYLIVSLVYALCIAHTIGYVVAYNISEDDPAAGYYEALAADNASFAWSTCLTLVIMSWLYSDYPPAAAVGAWIVLLLLVFLFLYLANYIQEVALELSIETRRRLRDFESDCFALAAAYSVTVVLAASVYHNSANNYLSHTDDEDLHRDFDDAYDIDSLQWLFFVYAAVFSLVVLGWQWRQDKRLRQRAAEVVAQDLRRHSNQRENAEETARLLEERDEEVVEEVRGVRGQWRQRLSALLCPWDEDRLCLQSALRFARVTIAYMVASAWHLWATLSFEAYFPFKYGFLVGQLLFALIATFAVALLLTIVTVKKELSGLTSLLDTSSTRLSLSARLLAEGEGLLYLSCGRLLVGWSWQSLFSATVAELVPGQPDSATRRGLALLCEAVITFLIFLAGRRLEVMLVRREERSVQRQKEKQIDLIEGDDRSVGNLSETLL